MAKVKLHSFLFSLAEKAGIDPKDAGLTEILSNAALDNVELSKDLESSINKSLLSVVDAKNNHPEIKTHYFAEIMANVDRSLDDFYREAGLDQKVIDEVSKERSSTKRIALLGTKLKEVIENASKSTKKAPEVDSLNQQINDLNEKLRVEKEGRKADNDKAKGEMNTFKTELNLNNKTGSVKTIYDELPSDVRAISIRNILEKELQDSNASFILDENGSLKLQKKDGSNYFDENNRQLTVDDFINKTLAKNKILKQSAPNSEQTGGSPANNGQPTTVQSNGKSKINIGSLMEESLKGLEAEPTKMI